jgi:5,5'-dehydrodivanillate O-demethylase
MEKSPLASDNDEARRSQREPFPLEYVQTGPDTLGGKYLRQFWHPVARAGDVRPGRAKTIKILSEEFTLYRGTTGKPHIVQNRCPHRNVMLSVGWVEEDAIRCLYHGWKYGEDGKCVERPAELGTGGIRIKTYPTEEFLGLIYGYFGEGEAPAFPPYPAFEGEGIIETMLGDFPCNYFQCYENDFDIYHANYTHATGSIHGPNDETRGEQYMKMALGEKWEETDYGLVRTMPTMSGQGANQAVCILPGTIRLNIPTFNEQARFPGPRFRPTYLVHTPIDDEHHAVFITQLVPVTGDDAIEYKRLYDALIEGRKSKPTPLQLADKIFASDGSIDDVKDHYLLVEIEDLLTQVGQGAIVDRSEEMLGRTDAGVVLLRRTWARELEKLRRGEPTTQWSYMADPPAGLRDDPFIVADAEIEKLSETV